MLENVELGLGVDLDVKKACGDGAHNYELDESRELNTN